MIYGGYSNSFSEAQIAIKIITFATFMLLQTYIECKDETDDAGHTQPKF